MGSTRHPAVPVPHPSPVVPLGVPSSLHSSSRSFPVPRSTGRDPLATPLPGCSWPLRRVPAPPGLRLSLWRPRCALTSALSPAAPAPPPPLTRARSRSRAGSSRAGPPRAASPRQPRVAPHSPRRTLAAAAAAAAAVRGAAPPGVANRTRLRGARPAPPPRGPAPRPRPQPRSDRLSTDHPWSPASGPLSHVGVRLALPEEARAVDGARGLAELGVGVSCGRGSAKRGSFLHSG